MKRVIVGLAILTVLWCSAAQADVIFTLGNNPQPDEENILFNQNDTGSTVSGVTNSSNMIVNFSSTTDNLIVTAGGQAKVTADDNLINNIRITFPGATFQDLIINPFVGTPGISVSATVEVVTNDMTDDFTYNLGNGNNFLTITTSGGELISRVTIDSTTGFEDLRQPRISGVGIIPEPTTMLLLGSGLLGLAGYGRKKFFKK